MKWYIVLSYIKNEWNTNIYLLAGDKLMPGRNLKLPGFTYRKNSET